ncbi:MAG TPA: PAS domain S-box protein [Granulicella sp.]|nr:PAS domain S-box protein [Granulicella sp.]
MKTSAQLKSYAFAVLLSGVGLAAGFEFDAPSSCLLLAVMGSAISGGLGPGLLTVTLSSIAFRYYFFTPVHHLALTQDILPRFLSLVGAMILATVVIDAKRRSTAARIRLNGEFRSLTEACPDCILTLDPAWTILFANPAMTKMFGYSAEQVIGQSVSFLLPELRKGRPPQGEFIARRNNGDRFDVEATCGHYNDNTTIFLRDISDRKRALKKLEDSEESLRLTLENIPGLVYTQSPGGDLQYANCRVTDFFGMTVAQLGAGAWADALHPDEREAVLGRTARNFSLGKPYAMEFRRRRADGVFRWFQTIVQPLRNRAGEVIRWYGLLIDVEERRNAEESLRRTQEKLAQANEASTIAELAASIVHEISQPLSAIVTNGQACLRWLSMKETNAVNARSAAERIVRDGKDTAEIIRGLRSLFKRSSPQMTSLDLRQLLDEVMILIRSRAEKESVSLDVQLPVDLPMITGDRIQLQQVLMNLNLNAIEAMRSVRDRPKRLIVRSRREGDMVLTEVEDHGTGIADAEKVFEAFYTTKEHGMGMGLAICRSIIEAHGGRLWCAPRPSAGTIFSFTIPLPVEPNGAV